MYINIRGLGICVCMCLCIVFYCCFSLLYNCTMCHVFFILVVVIRGRGYKVTSFYNHTGRVVAVGDGVAKISGLYAVASNEMVFFGNGFRGMVINLELDSVSVIIFTLDKNIYRGLWVYRTLDIMYMSIGCDLLGRVVNPLGIPIDGEGELFWSMRNRIEASSPGFIDREPVSISLITG